MSKKLVEPKIVYKYKQQILVINNKASHCDIKDIKYLRTYNQEALNDTNQFFKLQDT